MNKSTLTSSIFNKGSYLCVGLDPDLDKIPERFLKDKDPITSFNQKVIEATKDYSVAYKLNLAFYESLGRKGWEALERTTDLIPDEHFTIADAKRGDIGNTAQKYAKVFFEEFSFDAVTLSPYMGEDSISPFLEYQGKWVIILGLTSNAGANDFQLLSCPDKPLYQQVIETSAQWGSESNTMYVVGATQMDYLKHIRSIIPDHFLLVPGIGAQAGSLKEVSEQLLNKEGGILVNIGRDIIFAGSGDDFEEKVKQKAERYQHLMENYLKFFH